MLTTHPGRVHSPAILGTSSEVAKFLARTTGLNDTHANAYRDLINGLVGDGVWSILDALYMLATDTSTNAHINLKSSSFGLTVNGTPSFSADAGYTFSTSGDYLDTGFNPTSGGVNWVRDSAHAAGWGSKSGTTTGLYVTKGVVAGDNTISLYPKYTDNNGYYQINCSSAVFSSSAPASSARFQCVTRTASTTTVVYENAASIATSALASSAMIASVAIRIGGAAAEVYNGPLHFVSLGGGLDATKVAALYNRVHAYLTAIAGIP